MFSRDAMCWTDNFMVNAGQSSSWSPTACLPRQGQQITGICLANAAGAGLRLCLHTCGFDAGPLGSASATVVPGDEHMVGMALHNAGRDNANTILGDQLDTDAGPGVGGLEVVDELCQILDGVDVMVGWGRDEAHPGG